MADRDWSRMRSWWIVSASLGGLLIAIAVMGLVSLALNQRVKTVVDEAVRYDVELEHLGHEIRLAVLDLRNRHFNLRDAGPSATELAEFERSYTYLLETIAAIERLGVRDPDIPQPAALRAVAEEYHATFFPALQLYDDDPAGFTQASERGLMLLAELERDARIVQRVGEQQAGLALDSVEWTMTTAQLVLLGVLGGLGLIGAGLVYATVKVMNEFRRLYGVQQETAQRLAEALRAKNDFIADASHELRTPLTVLRGNAQLALALDSSCAHAELLGEILREANRLSRLVEDLLLLARADAASLPLVRERLAVGPFLAGLADRAAALARQHGASLRTALDAEGWLDVDPTRIEQGVLALVDNAAKYGPPGGVVVLASGIRGGELVIEVVDHGPGIPPEELPLIFERFYRVDKARSRARGGAGLGLPIAKTIIAAHGGRIEAMSHPGQGTTMRIFLPLAAPASIPQANSTRR